MSALQWKFPLLSLICWRSRRRRRGNARRRRNFKVSNCYGGSNWTGVELLKLATRRVNRDLVPTPPDRQPISLNNETLNRNTNNLWIVLFHLKIELSWGIFDGNWCFMRTLLGYSAFERLVSLIIGGQQLVNVNPYGFPHLNIIKR